MEDKILLILTKRREFLGTCFAVYRDGEGVYFVTCAHVVGNRKPEELVIESIAESEPWRFVDDEPDTSQRSWREIEWENLTLVYLGSAEGPDDLAVLRASAKDSERQPILPVSSDAKPDLKVFVVGGQSHLQNVRVEATPATLSRVGTLRSRSSPKSARVSDLDLDGKDRIALGNSGGPVVDEQGNVVGIILDRQDARQLGTALDISELPKFWPGCPSDLVKALGRSDVKDVKAEELAFTREPSRRAYQTNEYFQAHSFGFDDEQYTHWRGRPWAHRFEDNPEDLGENDAPFGWSYEHPPGSRYQPVLYYNRVTDNATEWTSAVNVLEENDRGDRQTPFLAFVAPFPADVQETLLSIYVGAGQKTVQSEHGYWNSQWVEIGSDPPPQGV